MKRRPSSALNRKTFSALAHRLGRKLPAPVKKIVRNMRPTVSAPAQVPVPAPKPTLSVIIPVYNVEDYVSETLDSLLNQSLNDWEAIIVNDGSTDSSLSILEKYAKLDSRFKVITQNNAGLGGARNTGINKAQGDFLTFLDADDIIPSEAYSIAIKTLRKTNSDFAIGGVQRLKHGSTYTPPWTKTVHETQRLSTCISEYPDMMMDIVACNRIFRTQFWDQQIGQFPVGVAYEDHRVMATALIRAKSIDILSQTTYIWRVRDDNTSISQQKAELENLTDRIGAKRETYDILRNEAPASVIDAWLTRVLDTDIPVFSNFALNASEEYKTHAQSFANDYVALAPTSAWDNVRWEQRVKTLLMAAGRWQSLGKFIADLRVNPKAPQTQISGSTVHIDTEKWTVPLTDILQGRTALGVRQTPQYARVYSTSWTSEGLLMKGFAYTSYITPTLDDKLAAFLENERTGHRFNLITHTTLDEENRANRFANHEGHDYRNSGMTILLGWQTIGAVSVSSDFNSADAWRIELQRTTGSVRRASRVDTTIRNGSGSVFVHKPIEHSNVSVTPYRDSSSLAIRFKKDAARLIEFSVNSLIASGKVSAVDPAGRIPKAIYYKAEGIRYDSELRSLGESNETTPASYGFNGLSLPRNEGHRLRVEFTDGSSNAITWSLGDPEYRLYNSAALTRSPFGFVDIDTNNQRYFAIGAQFESGSQVTFTLENTAPRLDSFEACLISAEGIVQATSSIHMDSSKTLPTVSFNIDILSQSGAALKGDLTLMINGVVVVPSLELSATFPISGISNFYRVDLVRGSGAAGRPLRLRVQPPLNDLEQGAWNQKRLRHWYSVTEFKPEKAVLFQCYRGETASDNQFEIFNELKRRQPEIRCYWGVTDGSVEIPDDAERLIIGSQEWYQKLGSVEYLCNNIDFDRFFTRRGHQKFLQTFHGHPFKAMGKSFWENAGYDRESIDFEIKRRRNAWTTALMPNTESVAYYQDEYSFDGDYLVAGYPRNDSIVTSDPSDARIRIAQRYCLDPTASSWVMYAPTWRESLSTGAWSASMFDELDLGKLGSMLGPEWTILVRGHNHNSRMESRVSRSANIVDVTDYPEINDLILGADVAVLDYSSLRFDWAITEKPVLYFVPDKEEYFDRRPGLFDYDDSAPGAQVTSTEEAAKEILRKDEYHERFGTELDIFNARFNSYSDGRAAERVVESFFSDIL